MTNWWWLQFTIIIYFFERYSITPSPPATTPRQVYRDELCNYVVKRSKEIIVRHRFLKVEDGELYFYQQLLLNVPARSEFDYKTAPDGTYREKFLSLYPDFLSDLQNQVTNTHHTRMTRLNNQFIEVYMYNDVSWRNTLFFLNFIYRFFLNFFLSNQIKSKKWFSKHENYTYQFVF